VEACTPSTDNRGFPGLDPLYIVATVELTDEPDVRHITNVVDVSADDIHVGLSVEVFFED